MGGYTLPHNLAGEQHFNGGSDWAKYWLETMRELAAALLESGHVTQPMLGSFQAHYSDPHYWTSVITFAANWGQKPR